MILCGLSDKALSRVILSLRAKPRPVQFLQHEYFVQPSKSFFRQSYGKEAWNIENGSSIIDVRDS